MGRAEGDVQRGGRGVRRRRKESTSQKLVTERACLLAEPPLPVVLRPRQRKTKRTQIRRERARDQGLERGDAVVRSGRGRAFARAARRQRSRWANRWWSWGMGWPSA